MHPAQCDNCLHNLAPQSNLVTVEEPERTALEVSEAQKTVGQQSSPMSQFIRFVAELLAAVLRMSIRAVAAGGIACVVDEQVKRVFPPPLGCARIPSSSAIAHDLRLNGDRPTFIDKHTPLEMTGCANRERNQPISNIIT